MDSSLSSPSSVPVLALSSLSGGRFMLRPAGPRTGVSYDRHRDDFYMFGVMLSDRQTVAVDFREITIVEQEAVIVVPGQVHEPIGAVTDHGFGIAFAPEAMTEAEIALIEEYSLMTVPIALGKEDFNDVKSLYEILLRRIGGDTEVEWTIASAIKGIILQNIAVSRNRTSNRYVRLLVELRKLLKEHIAAEKRPSAYAAMLNVSGVYLNEAVKSVVGMSANAYIISTAMLAAKRLLLNSGLSATEVAFRLGYEDYTYFSRLFRKHAGCGPRAFRQKYIE